MQALWIGEPEPPTPVASLARRADWTLRTVDPEDTDTLAAGDRPAAIFVGVVDTDFDALRAAAPAVPILYCPPETTADGVAAATAAGVDAVLPQDADAWSVETLERRLQAAGTPVDRPAPAVSDGLGEERSRGDVGEPPEAVETVEATSERPSPTGTLTVDEEGLIGYIGERAATLLDCDAERLVGQPLSVALPWEDLDRLLHASADLDADEGTVSTVERLMPANRWLSLSARPTSSGATITVRELDADARRRVVLDRLHGVSRRLFAAETAEAVAEVAVDAVRDVLGLELVAVRLYDPTDGTLKLAAQTQSVADLMPERPTYAVGEGMAGRAFENGRPRIHSELDDPERFGEIRSAICLPLGEYGTISVGSTAPDAFDEEDISLARLLETTVTVALERADREARLRRREAVLESIRGMVFALDEDRVIDYVSAPLAQRLGADRDDIIGTHVVEFVDIDAFYRAESRLRSGDDEITLDLQIDPVDGGAFPARVELSVLEHTDAGNSLVGVVEDRSTLAATREDLRREHERLWTLFENLPDPVVDAEHVADGPVIRAANDAFAEVFGVDREEIVGQRIDEVLSSPAGDAAGDMPPEAINEQVSGGEVTGAKVQRETERGTRTFLFRGIPYSQEDSVRAFGIYTDVTDIERRERHVKVLDRLLRHNLRNDLGVVIGRAENVLERSDDAEVRSEAADLVEAASGLIDVSDTAKRIRRIIEDPETERSSVPIRELLAAVAADARERFPTATIGVDAPADLAALATSDLRLALEELVENAVVHGGDDPAVELRAEPFAGAPEAWMDLLIVDNGPGIPETERAAITGDRDITQLEHGSGLGLWLVRWAVDSVGGDLAFEERNGRTAVRLRLRRADAE